MIRTSEEYRDSIRDNREVFWTCHGLIPLL